MSVSREPTIPELLRAVVPDGNFYAKKHERMEDKLREARTILSDIITSYEACFVCEPDEDPKAAATRLGEALEAGRQHIMACGFREMPREPFA